MQKQYEYNNHLVKHMPKIRAIIMRIAHDRNCVDDIAQECCLRIIEKADVWNQDLSSLNVWMNTLTRNATLNLVKSKKISGLPVLEEGEFDDREGLPGDDASIDYEDQIKWLLEQLSSLTETEKQLIHMKYFQGMMQKQIAATMGLSPVAVSLRLRHTLEKLKKRATKCGTHFVFAPALLQIDRIFVLPKMELSFGLPTVLTAFSVGLVSGFLLSVQVDGSAKELRSRAHTAMVAKPNVMVVSENLQRPPVNKNHNIFDLNSESEDAIFVGEPINVLGATEINSGLARDMGIRDWPCRDLLLIQKVKDLQKDLQRLKAKRAQKDGDETGESAEEGNEKEPSLSIDRISELRMMRKDFKKNFRSKSWRFYITETYFKDQDLIENQDKISESYHLLMADFSWLDNYDREMEQRLDDKKIARLSLIADRVEKQFDGDVKKYVEATLPKQIDISDRKHFYLLYLFYPYTNPIRRKELMMMDQLQRDYENRGLMVVGVVPDFVGKNSALPYVRKHQINVKKLRTIVTRMGADMPRCMIGIDDLDGQGVMDDYLGRVPRIGRRGGPQIVPKVVMINKKGEVVWIGEPENLRYHLDEAIEERFKWNDFMQIHGAKKLTVKYQLSLNSSASHPQSKKLADQIFASAKNDPAVLMNFSSKVLTEQTLYSYRDAPLALKFCLRAYAVYQQKCPGKTDTKIWAALAQAYYENGSLQKALEYVRLAQAAAESDYTHKEQAAYPLEAWLIKWNKQLRTIGEENFKRLKHSENLIAIDFWPHGIKGQMDSETMKKRSRQVLAGIKFDPDLLGELLFRISLDIRIDSNNEAVKEFSHNCTELIMKDIEGLADKDQQARWAARAIYEYKFGDLKTAQKLMEKAISLNPQSESVRRRYRPLLKKRIVPVAK